MKEYYSFKIPEPCHEDWNQMTPSAKGRFCSSCEKTVVDFTNMTSSKIGNYLKENIHKGVCGHTYKSQLDRVVLHIPASTLHDLRFSNRFFALALLIVMGTTLFSCANDNGNRQKIDAVQVIERDSVLYDSSITEVMTTRKFIRDSTSNKSLEKKECDIRLLKTKDSIDHEVPITGGFTTQPPAPPVVIPVITGEVVAVEGLMVLDDSNSNEVPYELAYSPPEFPNTPANMNREEGKKYFSDQIQQHIKTHFNFKVLESSIMGMHKISAQFKIDTAGQVTDVKTKANYQVLENEARRVLKTLPSLKSGRNGDGEKVTTIYALPIIFEN